MSESEFEHEQEEAAAEEAAAIGGRVDYDPPEGEDSLDPAEAPLIEAGEGESEGFELAEQELEEHASHGDMHAARRVLEDAPEQEDDERAAPGGEADAEPSSERPDDR
ncbi:MAG TPA: hypothetical protein VGL51_03075 [Solirubrobacteraceae bacterium]|jgi:hypothetical protein